MHACYRSAGLTPHQCGWINHDGINFVMSRCNSAVSARLFAKRHAVVYTTVFLLSAATHRASMGYIELGPCYL